MLGLSVDLVAMQASGAHRFFEKLFCHKMKKSGLLQYTVINHCSIDFDAAVLDLDLNLETDVSCLLRAFMCVFCILIVDGGSDISKPLFVKPFCNCAGTYIPAPGNPMLRTVQQQACEHDRCSTRDTTIFKLQRQLVSTIFNIPYIEHHTIRTSAKEH